MGMDVCRYIEIYTKDYDGYIYDKNDLQKIGKFVTGDIVMVYNSYGPYHNHYFEVSDVFVDGYIEYKPLKLPEDLNEHLKIISELNIVYRCENYEDLPKKQLNIEDGVIYKYYNNGERYVQRCNNEWVELDECPATWKPIKWKEKNNYIVGGCNYFVRRYLMDMWDNTGKLAKRGLPNDLTDYTKSQICNTDFNYTYCTLNEIEDILFEIEDEMKKQISAEFTNKKIDILNRKIDCITSYLKTGSQYVAYLNDEDDEDDYSENNFDEVFDEYVSLLEQIKREYTIIDTMVSNLHGFIVDSNIRIIYTFNN